MKHLCLKKTVTAAFLCFYLIFTLSLSSCIYLEDIRPVTSDPVEESSYVSGDKSSVVSSEGEESGNNSDITSEESSADESSAESSEEPQLKSYDYEGFRITGYEKNDISALITSLKAAISTAGVNIGIYYEDLDSGYSVSYNKDKKYCSGSVIKAPYAMYLMSANIDLTQKLALMASQKMEGSGTIKNNAAGSEYTIEKLIEYSVVNSDNTAYRMLYDNFDFGDFNLYTYELGVDTGCTSSDYLGYLGFMSAYDAGLLFKDIYLRSLTSDKAGRLLAYLKNTQYNYLLPAGITNHPVAHKYGYMTGSYKVLHDAGIVLSDHPYVIAIMTDFDPAGGNGRTTFKSVSSAINGFHDNYGG